MKQQKYKTVLFSAAEVVVVVVVVQNRKGKIG